MERVRAAICGFIGVLALAQGPSEAQAPEREQAMAAYREGNGLFDQNKFAEAVAAYDRALEQDSRFAEAYHNRAIAYEMVDRKKAIADFRRFLELAADSADLKWDVARVQARLQVLAAMPEFPAAMHPSRYVTEAGDYYWSISKDSEGEEWSPLPVKVFLGSAPQLKWQEGAREAFNIWSALFPMELVALPQRADIRVAWEESTREGRHAGEAYEMVYLEREGGELTGRRVAYIRVDLSRPWSKDEVRAIILHEMGHALGIKGHSDTRKDIMWEGLQQKVRRIPVPVIPRPFFWRTLVKNPSQRDVNTLIRLYNTAGPIARFK